MADSDDRLSARERERDAPDGGPLAVYGGARPPAPAWFEEAVATPYRRGSVEVEGAFVHYQAWGESGQPGVLLVHGNGAHAHWWDFVAPYLSAERHVVAMTFSGMGESDWRSTYRMSQFAREQVAVCEAAGLFDAPRKPVLVAHSFGGFVALQTAVEAGDRFAGTVIVDSALLPPDEDRPGPPRRTRPNRVYPDLATALGRFRLAPPQPCENHYLMDYIARWSLKRIESEEASGYSWKFDPFIFQSLDDWTRPGELVGEGRCPFAVMRGADSVLVTDRVWAYMRTLFAPDTPFISIPHAEHHVMLDQPLAFIAALRTLLETWPRR